MNLYYTEWILPNPQSVFSLYISTPLTEYVLEMRGGNLCCFFNSRSSLNYEEVDHGHWWGFQARVREQPGLTRS